MSRIFVYNGPDDKSMLIGEIFGTPNHKAIKDISSSGRSIFINFRKLTLEYYFNAETVVFEASIKYNKINSDCQSWLDNNVLMSPDNPNINCSWLITRQIGSYITLHFTFIEVKPMNVTEKMKHFRLHFSYIA